MYQDWMDQISIMGNIDLCDDDKKQYQTYIIIGVVKNEK